MRKSKVPCPSSGLVFPARRLTEERIPSFDAHMHTRWTDGKDSVESMHQAAIQAGLISILFSEHSRKTSIDWFPCFAGEVRTLPNEICHAYVGTEVKVESFSGKIDTCPEITNLCDLVIGSVHRFVDENDRTIEADKLTPNQALYLEYQLTLAMLDNPNVNIIGHIFGMSISRKKILPSYQMISNCISKAAAKGVAVEINSRYHPNLEVLIKICLEHNALISLGSDAHCKEDIGKTFKILRDHFS